jgi:hypothetical protein
MNPNDRPLFVALLAVAFAGFAIAGSTLVKEPVELNWETVWVGVTGLFTVVLAVSTIGLWIATKAAGQRADAVIRTSERAYAKMSHAPPGLRLVRTLTIDNSAEYMITVEVTNFGRTPAKVTDAMVKRVTLPVDQKLPVKPDYARKPGSYERPKAFLVTNDSFSFTERWKIKAHIELPKPTHVVYAIGYVDYEDAFGNRYRAGYARRYKPERNIKNDDVYPSEESYRCRSNLVFVTQEDYNYDEPIAARTNS